MELKTDPSRVLMSDVLKGQVPELEGEAGLDPVSGKHVIVVAEKVTNGSKKEGLVGILRSVLFDVEPEIEFRIDLTEALNIVEAQRLAFGGFELHHEARVIPMPGPFVVKACRIDDISAQDQLCTISLHLKKQPR
jgi:hypothetical protein